MTDSYASYETAMRDAWRGWWITWPLSRRVGVGDVYSTSDGVLGSAGSLPDRGVAFGCSPPAPPATFTYDSNGSATVRFKLAGATPPGFSTLAVADAGALVEFDKASSVLVIYTGLVQRGIADTRALAAGLVRLYWTGRWDKDLVAVTEVVSANAGTVLAAASSGGSAELRVAVTVGSGPATLADLAGSVSVARTAHVGLHWVGSDVSPFFRVIRLRTTWLGKVTVAYGPRQPGAGAAPTAVPPILVEEARDDPDAVIETASAREQPPMEVAR